MEFNNESEYRCRAYSYLNEYWIKDVALEYSECRMRVHAYSYWEILEVCLSEYSLHSAEGNGEENSGACVDISAVTCRQWWPWCKTKIRELATEDVWWFILAV